jgi:hypothetical protein
MQPVSFRGSIFSAEVNAALPNPKATIREKLKYFI